MNKKGEFSVLEAVKGRVGKVGKLDAKRETPGIIDSEKILEGEWIDLNFIVFQKDLEFCS